jgi:hypothetical protein
VEGVREGVRVAVLRAIARAAAAARARRQPFQIPLERLIVGDDRRVSRVRQKLRRAEVELPGGQPGMPRRHVQLEAGHDAVEEGVILERARAARRRDERELLDAIGHGAA